MNITKIKELFDRCPDKRKAASDMGTTYQNMYNLIYKGSVCKVDLIERIAHYFNKPVGYFFDEDVNSTLQVGKDVSFYEKEIERLKNALQAKTSTRVVVELDVDSDEFVKMGLKDKVIRILNK